MNTEEDRKLQWWSVAALNLVFLEATTISMGQNFHLPFFKQRGTLLPLLHMVCVCLCMLNYKLICVQMKCQLPPSDALPVWQTHNASFCPVSRLCDFVPRSWSLWDFYLIVSSLPLSCWNLLWRFLICSSETEKREQKPTARRKVCHWHTPTTMIIIFKPHAQDYNCPSVVITGGVSRPCTEPGRKSTCSYFLSQLFWTFGLQFWFYSTFVLTGSAAVATAFVPGSLPL